MSATKISRYILLNRPFIFRPPSMLFLALTCFGEASSSSQGHRWRNRQELVPGAIALGLVASRFCLGLPGWIACLTWASSGSHRRSGHTSSRPIRLPAPLSRLPRAANSSTARPSIDASCRYIVSLSHSGGNGRFSGIRIPRGAQRTVKRASKRGVPPRSRRGVCVTGAIGWLIRYARIPSRRGSVGRPPGDPLFSPFWSASVRAAERQGVAPMDAEAIGGFWIPRGDRLPALEVPGRLHLTSQPPSPTAS